MDEVNPMAEMGLVHDKQIIVEAQGFMTPCEAARIVAAEFIPDGAKLFDLLDRYDFVATYVLNRDGVSNSTDSNKLLALFLKAFDVTDYELRKFFGGKLPAMPGAGEAMGYFLDTMPTFVDSRMYEHALWSLCEKLDVPVNAANASPLDLDSMKMSRQTCRELRAVAADICALRLSGMHYELNVPAELDEDEMNMISVMDGIFLKKLQGTEAIDTVNTLASVGPNEKAYALLDIRKSTQVDLDGTVYIGSDVADFQAMDLVKDGNGLALAFNGSELAIHGCNVAVLSEDCIAATVLAAKFYDTGIQGVFDLADNWNREYLETADFPDRNLLNEMLARFPDGLPEVYRVTRSNAAEVAKKSDAFRKKLFGKYAPETPSA